jgi:cysteinyl-tRNA synthetase
MRRHVISTVLIAGLVAASGSHATGNHDHHMQCDYNSDYDVQVQARGIAFTRNGEHAADVFMHDGQLRVDGHVVAVSSDDAIRLREYEQQVRDLVPVMAAIARDGVDIGYTALTTVVATLDDNGDDRTRMLQSLHDRRIEALQQVDETLGRGVWRAGDEDELFSNNLEKTVSDLVGRITGNAVSDALSGDSTRLAALEARAGALNATLDKAVKAPAEKLGQRAEALCPRLSTLNQLQQQFQFRLADGERLQLLSTDMDSSNKAGQYAQR